MNSIPELVADKLLGGLKAVQIGLWPDTNVFITDEEAKARIWPQTVEYYRGIYPDGIWYRCGKDQCFLGMRYGAQPHEYLTFIDPPLTQNP